MVGLSISAFQSIEPLSPGDVMYYKALGNSILILNSYDAMIDLCEKRGEIYSSRPVRTMPTEL